MHCVILESPYKGDAESVEANSQYARECMLDALKRMEAPMVSHLLYTQVLDDDISNERTLGIEAGLSWGVLAEYVVVYTNRGISKGMAMGIERAKRNNKRIVYRRRVCSNEYLDFDFADVTDPDEISSIDKVVQMKTSPV